MEEFQINNIDENIKLIDYKPNDLSLLNPIEITNEFGLKEDIIEFHILDNNNNILESDYNYQDYIIQDNVNNGNLFNSITLDLNKLPLFKSNVIELNKLPLFILFKIM